MKKLISYLMFSLFIILMCISPVSVLAESTYEAAVATANDSHPSRLIDDQDLLSDTEEQSVLSVLDSISEEIEEDIVILTTDELNEVDDVEFCDDYFDYNGYGLGENRDGVLLAFDAVDGLWYISTRGYAIEVFSDYLIDEVFDGIRQDLRDENYESAFIDFAESCRYWFNEAESGYYVNNYGDTVSDYDYDTSSFTFKEAFLYDNNGIKAIGLSLLVGILVSTIVVKKMENNLKSVANQRSADNYIKPGSMKITENRDMFLYKKVSSRPLPPPSSSNSSHGGSSHSSSSGASHGGHGGRL